MLFSIGNWRKVVRMHAKFYLFLFALVSICSICIAEDFWIRTNFHTEPYSMASDIFYTSQNEIYVNSYDSVYKSLDMGNTWEMINFEGVKIYSNKFLYTDPNKDKRYYHIRCSTTNGLYDSENDTSELNLLYATNPNYGLNDISVCKGNNFLYNWGQIVKFNEEWSDPKLVLDENNEEEITSFAVDSLGTYYAGSTDFMNIDQPGGVYKSYDNGETWTYPDLPNHFVRAMVVDSEGRIFVGTHGHYSNGTGLIYRSIDNGNTWETIASGTYVFSMAINSDDEIFVGLDADGGTPGVLYSEDNGDSWALLDSGFPGGDVNDIAISQDGFIYLATQIGVYKSVNSTTGIEGGESESVKNFELFQNYPNPFNNETLIAYSLEQDSYVEISIFNSRGEFIEYLIKSKQSKGKYTINLNADGLTTGVYYYKLSTNGSQIATKKLLYLK